MRLRRRIRRRIKSFATLLVAAIALACMAPVCIPVPSPAPLPDASLPADASTPDVDMDAAATPCARACARLASLGCPEMGAACVQTCQHLVVTNLTPFSPDCVIAAETIETVRKCPAVRCRI
jgi:hypothetical protein